MNFLFRNNLSEKDESSRLTKYNEIDYQLESSLLIEIPYELHAIINVGFWVNDILNNKECKED
jgi:hypothetical protein